MLRPTRRTICCYVITIALSAAMGRVGSAAEPPAPRLKSLVGQTDFELAKKSKCIFSNPSEHRGDVLELRLTTGRFTDPDGPDVGAPVDFQLLCYNKLRVGPTIRVRRGTTLNIRLKNDLIKFANARGSDPTKPKASDGAEPPHKLSRTNLHTHGIHTSPADPSDNIFLCIGPNESADFKFKIPKDHPSGTFWYHPHHHGSVAYQLSNGVAAR